MIVRPEAAADRDAVYRVNESAFGQPDEARIVEAVRRVKPRVSLVAEIDGEVVGHILFTPVTIRPQDQSAGGAGDRPELICPPFGGAPLTMGLGPMAVVFDRQRSGIGSKLIDEGLEACRELGAVAVFVLGHADYYPRFGFRPARELGFEYKSETFDPYFFVLELQRGALEDLSGSIQYAPPFEGG